MKKIKLLVMAAAITLGISTSAYAKLPANSIVVGSNVYDITYLENPSNTQSINNQIMNNLGAIYFVNSSGNAVDLFSGAIINDSDIVSKVGNALTYYTSTGTTKSIIADANNQYTDPSYSNLQNYAIFNISYKQISSTLYMLNSKVSQIEGINDAGYFKIGNSAIVPLTDTATYMEQALSTQLPTQISTDDVVQIYGRDGNTLLAQGTIIKVDIPTGAGAAGQQNVTVTLTPTSQSTPVDSTVKGNSPVNIANNGFVTVDSNNQWIYYNNTGDGNKLYKKSTTGVTNTPICDDDAKYINVVGDWVYYSNYKDSGKIYKIKTDGTQRQKVSNNVASYINVVGGKIYYINNSDKARIYVIDSQGERQLISDSAKFLSVTGTFLFYINSSDSDKLYSYRIATGTKNKISDINTQFMNAVSDYSVYYVGKDGVLYAANGNPEQALYPVQMPVTTNVPGKSTKGSTNYMSMSDKLTTIWALNNDNIYYRSYADGGKIYRLDGTGNGYKIVDDSADYINIVDDYIYYMKAGKAYIAPMDGDGTQKGTAVAKPKSTLKIKQVESLPSYTTTDINNFVFPEKIACIMSDGSIQQLVVNWNKTIPKPQKGVYTFSGTVLGYGTKVTLSVVLNSGNLDISANSIIVKNNAGSRDTVSVSALTQGDIISVYDSSTATKALKSATADANGNVNITGLNLNADGGYIYLTLTKSGKSEGQKVIVGYPPETPTGFAIDAQNKKITGLKASKQYKVYIKGETTNGIIPSTLPSTSTPFTSASDGTIDISSLFTFDTNINQAVWVAASATGGDSLPSSPLEISKAKVPSYVAIDFNLGRITGTISNMQYSYDYDPNNPNGSYTWSDCQNGATPISLIKSLQVSVRVKGSGPILQSDPKTFGLFVSPVITGIQNGNSYDKDNFPTVTWNANSNNITYVATLTKPDGNGVNVADGADLKNNINSTGDGSYTLTVTGTKSGVTNSTSVSFIVNSTAPSPVDITFRETPGTQSTSDPLTYYQATPIWTNLAGTINTATIQMIKDVSGNNIAGAVVGFTEGSTVIQSGTYKLTVTTRSTENGAVSTSSRTFTIDAIDQAVSPTNITDNSTGNPITEGTVYTSLSSGIGVGGEASNCSTKITISRDGHVTDYTPGAPLTINGNYVLILNTTNNKNGATTQKMINFTIDNTTP